MYQKHGYPGLLIVLEGTDGVGKSTQVNMLSDYIKDKCFGCSVSQWKTSRLISGVINEAKEKNILNTTTFSLLYAADYTDRLENEIIPALKAGFVVLMDRYVYTDTLEKELFVYLVQAVTVQSFVVMIWEKLQENMQICRF